MSNMRAPEPEGDNPAITPPSNPYPFHEPLRVEHHSDEDKRQAWDEGYAAGVVAGRSVPSTGTGWDRGYAAGLAAVRSWLRDEIFDPADGNGGSVTLRHLLAVFDVKFGLAARDTPDGER